MNPDESQLTTSNSIDTLETNLADTQNIKHKVTADPVIPHLGVILREMKT